MEKNVTFCQPEGYSSTYFGNLDLQKCKNTLPTRIQWQHPSTKQKQKMATK